MMFLIRGFKITSNVQDTYKNKGELSGVAQIGPTDDPGPTFRPRPQVTGSNIMYTGNGFLPCNGFVPCQPDSLPPWKNAARLEGAMPGWREEWDGTQGVYKPPDDVRQI